MTCAIQTLNQSSIIILHGVISKISSISQEKVIFSLKKIAKKKKKAIEKEIKEVGDAIATLKSGKKSAIKAMFTAQNIQDAAIDSAMKTLKRKIKELVAEKDAITLPAKKTESQVLAGKYN